MAQGWTKAHDSTKNAHWVNFPSTDSPIVDDELNRNEVSVDTIDDRVLTLDITKAEQSDFLTAFTSISFNSSTGVFTFTRANETTVTIDTDIEKIAINFDFDDDPTSPHYQQLIIQLDDGSYKYVDLSALLTQYEFTDSATIHFTLDNDGTVIANVIDGSITESKLQPNFLADCRAAKTGAENAELDAIDKALVSEGWAVGTQNGEPVTSESPYYRNNAEWYKDQAQAIAAQSIGGLSDVTIDHPVENEVLTYTGTQWENKKSVSRLQTLDMVGKTITFNDDGSISVDAEDYTEEITFGNNVITSAVTIDGVTTTKTTMFGGFEIETDSEPYSIRQSRAIPKAGNTYNDELVGGSLAWNQSVQNGNFVDTSSWSANIGTLTASNNVGFFTSGNGNRNRLYQPSEYKTGHKYLFTFEYKSNYEVKLQALSLVNLSFPSNTDFERAAVMANYNNSYTGIYFYNYTEFQSNDWELYIRNVMSFDLTQMFGSTIADYIYTLETQSAGSGAEFVRKLFPNDYYAYDTGSLQSVNVSAHKTYDENDNVIGNYAIDSSIELRGLYKLDANSKLYCDGDTYESDGTVTRKYGIVDLGTLDWEKKATKPYDFASTTALVNAKLPPDNNSVPSAICSNYQIIKYTASELSTKNLTIIWNGSAYQGKVWITDADYSDAQTFKTAISGVYLVYELATPTTESATPFTNPQTYDKNGTEEYVDYKVSQNTRDVAIPAGHNTTYFTGDNVITDTILSSKVPEMTSNTAPSGVVTGSSKWSDSYDYWKALAATNNGCWASGRNLLTNQYIDYEFETPQIINAVEWYNRKDSDLVMPPNHYKIQASNDGTNYVDLTPVCTNNVGTRNAKHFVSFANNTSYKHYRFFAVDLLDTGSNDKFIAVGLIKFMGI